jgi:predicted DNA-binding protein (UPF0251 family)
MSRPAKHRTVSFTAGVTRYTPVGIPEGFVETASMTLDQLEALRLADLLGHSHEEAARRMRVSRATFGRIVGSARRTVADALVHGKSVTIGGGPCTFTFRQRFYCPRCRHEHAGTLAQELKCDCCSTGRDGSGG